MSEPRKFHTPTIDRDRTVSRRFWTQLACHFNGRTAQPQDLLQPQDVTSRHRVPTTPSIWAQEGSACYPRYLLSFEWCPFHAETPDHYALVSYLLDLLVSQSSALMPLHSETGYQSVWGHLKASVTLFWRRPPQSNYPPISVLVSRVRTQTNEGSYFNSGSTNTGVPASKPPTYPTHHVPKFNDKL